MWNRISLTTVGGVGLICSIRCNIIPSWRASGSPRWCIREAVCIRCPQAGIKINQISITKWELKDKLQNSWVDINTDHAMLKLPLLIAANLTPTIIQLLQLVSSVRVTWVVILLNYSNSHELTKEVLHHGRSPWIPFSTRAQHTQDKTANTLTTSYRWLTNE